MMKDPPLVKILCARFCTFYKPGKNEELACKGYAVMERLMLSNKRITGEQYGQLPDTSVMETLLNNMCVNCDFHEQDCDFYQDRKALPCGGFVLISQLLGSGAITLEEIM